MALVRTAVLSSVAWWAAWKAAGSAEAGRRPRWANLLPLLVIADLLGSHSGRHAHCRPKVLDQPPDAVGRLKKDPSLIRVYGKADKSATEPGYASEFIDFFAVRDQLDWTPARCLAHVFWREVKRPCSPAVPLTFPTTPISAEVFSRSRA